MPDPHSLQELLSRLSARLADPGEVLGHSQALLQQTLAELRVAVDDLRLAEEALGVASRACESARQGDGGDAALQQDVFRGAPSALLVTDPRGVILCANPAAAALLGTPAAALRGTSLGLLVAAESAAAYRGVLRTLLGRGTPASQLLELRPAQRLPVEVEATGWRGSGGALCWSLADQTLVRQQQAAGSEANRVLRQTLDSLPLGVAAMDVDGSVLVWNREAARLLGWSEEELAGMPNPALPEALLPVADSVRLAGTEPRLTLSVTASAERREGGSLRVDLSLSPLGAGEGSAQGTVAVFRPVRGGGEGRESAAPATGLPLWPPAELRRVLFAGAESELPERMRAGIAAALELGYLRPGDRLPGAREAAAASGADHRVVSAAYRRLAGEGLVQVRPRRGAQVACCDDPGVPALGETPEWLAGVLEGAAGMQVRLPALPELVRRWTASRPVRCLCVDGTEDGRAALVHELGAQWGMEAVALADGRGAARELSAGLKTADLVVCSHFSAALLRPLARAAQRPLVLAGLNPGLVEVLESELRRRAVTVLVVDRAYGERLRAVPGGERLRVVEAGDGDAVRAVLAQGEAVLVTLAAQARLNQRPRQLWAPAHFVAPLDPRAVARVLVRANLAPGTAASGNESNLEGKVER